VVTGYPHLFEPASGIPDAVNNATDALNATIEQAVTDAQAADVNIRYVDVTAEFAGHGIVKLINDPAKPSDPSAFIHSPFICALTTDPKCQDPAAFHPNADGYSAYADAISATLPRGWLDKTSRSAASS
jgi:hypothetical protein